MGADSRTIATMDMSNPPRAEAQPTSEPSQTAEPQGSVNAEVSMREQFLNLLGQGMEPSEATKLVGCASEVLTELLKDSAFTKELRGLRNSHRQEIIEDSYAKLEQRTLKAAEKKVEQDEFLTVTDITRLLETVSKNRILYRAPAAHYQNPTAHLTIEVKVPLGAASQGVTLDAGTGQIVAIGDRNMSGMPIQGIRKLFKGLEAEETVQEPAPQPEPKTVAEILAADLEADDSDAHEEALSEAQSLTSAEDQARSFA